MSDTSYPAYESLAYSSRALVATDRPARYAKQLASHMGHKISVTELGPDAYRLTFNRDGHFTGYGDLLVQEHEGKPVLVMLAKAPDAQLLEKLEGVLARHLERFGQKDELKVVFAPYQP